MLHQHPCVTRMVELLAKSYVAQVLSVRQLVAHGPKSTSWPNVTATVELSRPIVELVIRESHLAKHSSSACDTRSKKC